MNVNPVLTCVQFAADGVTCTTTQWVQQSPALFPPMSVADGSLIGAAIMAGCVAIWAANFVGRGM